VHAAILGEHTANINRNEAAEPGSWLRAQDAVHGKKKTRSGVEVVSRKIGESTETTKYRGEELVSAAAAPDFRTAMIHATITGLDKDEPADEGC
jgi:hypothetical protein